MNTENNSDIDDKKGIEIEYWAEVCQEVVTDFINGYHLSSTVESLSSKFSIYKLRAVAGQTPPSNDNRK